MSESIWYNPLSWSLPSTQTVEVPWDKVRDSAQTACNNDMSLYTRLTSSDLRGVALEVNCS